MWILFFSIIFILFYFSFKIWTFVRGKFTDVWYVWKKLHASWCHHTHHNYQVIIIGVIIQCWWSINCNLFTHFFYRTDFLITASCDGHVKFWKKTEELIEFVKHFRSHLTPITDLTDNYNGTLMCTISTDQTVKVYDVINFGKSKLLDFICIY